MVFRVVDDRDEGDVHTGTRVCRKCDERKPMAEFHWAASKKHRTRTCKSCVHARQAIRIAERKEQGDPVFKADRLRREYGLTPEDVAAMREAQGNCCAICEKPFRDEPASDRMHIDHCHDTGHVRALLCHNCNLGLGHFRDDGDLMLKAIAYLTEHRSRTSGSEAPKGRDLTQRNDGSAAARPRSASTGRRKGAPRWTGEVPPTGASKGIARGCGKRTCSPSVPPTPKAASPSGLSPRSTESRKPMSASSSEGRSGPMSNPKIHILTGLPASGKTTAARQLLAESKGHIRRVNLDDIRRMLDHNGQNKVWSRAHEATALDVQDAAVRSALAGGFDVVVDNTHLTPSIPKRIKEAAGGQAVFVVHDFTHVPIEECIRRDAVRGEAMVGEDVIRRLHGNHVKATKNGWRLTADWLGDHPVVKPYEPDTGLPSAVMCDIDGTLALMGDRGPYDFSRCGEDHLNESVRRALVSFRLANNDEIVLLSGRGEEYREHTERWLAKHAVPYDELHMRAAGDVRRDDIVKAELFDAHVRDRFHVRVSLDDRDRVVALWRRMGLPTWQVNYGAF